MLGNSGIDLTDTEESPAMSPALYLAFLAGLQNPFERATRLPLQGPM